MAGSLVAFALRITDVDPLKHDLIFERFLNPERVSMPDIDIDFDDLRRGEVIDYVKRKYGETNVTQIITFGTMGAKGVIRDVGRALGFPVSEIDRIAKLVPDELGTTLDDALRQTPDLARAAREGRQLRPAGSSRRACSRAWRGTPPRTRPACSSRPGRCSTTCRSTARRTAPPPRSGT